MNFLKKALTNTTLKQMQAEAGQGLASLSEAEKNMTVTGSNLDQLAQARKEQLKRDREKKQR